MSKGKSIEHAVICPKCHKEHYVKDIPIDTFIYCECGYDFYVFDCQGLVIMMTESEARFEPTAREMRHFVVRTGRCQDIPCSLYCDIELNTEERLEAALQDYQMKNYGECFLTEEVVRSICEKFKRNKDILMKKQKDSVEVIPVESHRERFQVKSNPALERAAQYRSRIVDITNSGIKLRRGDRPNGILMNTQDKAAAGSGVKI